MTRALLLLLVACACSAPVVHRSAAQPPKAKAHEEPAIRTVWANPNARAPGVELTTFGEKPELDLVSIIVPELMSEARWPLAFADHPVLEPHFSIARELAEPGITWIDLCSRGAQNRIIAGKQDLVRYLRAWCMTLDRRDSEALDLIAPLLRSDVRGLPDGVRSDIASLLVGNDAERALLLMKQAQISDVETTDILSAFYIDIGQDADARAMNAVAEELDRGAPEVRRCHRIARLALADEYFAHVELDHLFKNYTDATCEKLREQISCLIGLRTSSDMGCDEYFGSLPDKMSYRWLVITYSGWPRYDADFSTWEYLAHGALNTRPLPGADEMAVSAIEAMQRVAECTPKHLESLASVIRWAHASTLAPPLAARLAEVEKAVAACAPAQSP